MWFSDLNDAYVSFKRMHGIPCIIKNNGWHFIEDFDEIEIADIDYESGTVFKGSADENADWFRVLKINLETNKKYRSIHASFEITNET